MGKLIKVNSKTACVVVAKDKFSGTEEELFKIAHMLKQYGNVNECRIAENEDSVRIIFAFNKPMKKYAEEAYDDFLDDDDDELGEFEDSDELGTSYSTDSTIDEFFENLIGTTVKDISTGMQYKVVDYMSYTNPPELELESIDDPTDEITIFADNIEDFNSTYETLDSDEVHSIDSEIASRIHDENEKINYPELHGFLDKLNDSGDSLDDIDLKKVERNIDKILQEMQSDRSENTASIKQAEGLENVNPGEKKTVLNSENGEISEAEVFDNPDTGKKVVKLNNSNGESEAVSEDSENGSKLLPVAD
jgi:hypothetical protein